MVKQLVVSEIGAPIVNEFSPRADTVTRSSATCGQPNELLEGVGLPALFEPYEMEEFLNATASDDDFSPRQLCGDVAMDEINGKAAYDVETGFFGEKSSSLEIVPTSSDILGTEIEPAKMDIDFDSINLSAFLQPETDIVKSDIFPQVFHANSDLSNLPGFGIDSQPVQPKKRWSENEFQAMFNALNSVTERPALNSKNSNAPVSIADTKSLSLVPTSEKNSISLITSDESRLIAGDNEELDSKSNLKAPGDEVIIDSVAMAKAITLRYKKYLALSSEEIAHGIKQLTGHELASINFDLLKQLMRRAGFTTQQIEELKLMRKKEKNRITAKTCLLKKKTELRKATENTKKLGQVVQQLEKENQKLKCKCIDLEEEKRLVELESSARCAENERLKRQVEFLRLKLQQLVSV